ncbi:unnamed protein product [Diatraea saccharalis]|uniref:Uncharacterized protein n=1 Tax=Diatraea saccharalis TaxID=40085 RepID=A0A9N9QP66_9NEOP|nr:unnamed protein product [Diatraea saccharalis]
MSGVASRMEIILFAVVWAVGEARMFCEKTKMPLEVGEWRYDLKHLDSAVVENQPVTISQGQIYVYENYFPGHTIKYIHVDNMARRTCGASASIKSGGVGTPSVLIVLESQSNQEIRSVVEVWGTKDWVKPKPQLPPDMNTKNIKSLYLFKKLRAVNHNTGY